MQSIRGVIFGHFRIAVNQNQTQTKIIGKQ